MINKGISKNKSKGKQKSKVSTRTKHNGRLNINKGTKTKKQKLNTLLNYNGNKTKKNVKSTGFKTKKKHYGAGALSYENKKKTKMGFRGAAGLLLKRTFGLVKGVGRAIIITSAILIFL